MAAGAYHPARLSHLLIKTFRGPKQSILLVPLYLLKGKQTANVSCGMCQVPILCYFENFKCINLVSTIFQLNFISHNNNNMPWPHPSIEDRKLSPAGILTHKIKHSPLSPYTTRLRRDINSCAPLQFTPTASRNGISPLSR